MSQKQTITYYPVVIYTLNRYEHFRRCVESLAKNTHAEKTELVIGLDYPPAEKYVEGYRKIKEYLPSITGFGKVTIFERKENFGAVKNSLALCDYVFEYHDACIMIEDDNEFSPCFLDYMNKMLCHYHDDLRVATVSSYLSPVYKDLAKGALLFTIDNNAWGYGIWRDKYGNSAERRAIAMDILRSWRLSWRCFWAYPAGFRMLISMAKRNCTWGDIIRSHCNVVNHSFQVRPAVSLTRNWGNDGSGINCTVDESLAKQTISDALTFEDPEDWEPYYTKEVAHATFRLTWPKNNFLFMGKMIVAAIKYLGYRIGSRK